VDYKKKAIQTAHILTHNHKLMQILKPYHYVIKPSTPNLISKHRNQKATCLMLWLKHRTRQLFYKTQHKERMQ